MEDSKNLYPPLPSNYVTIVDLQKRWMQQKQQQQEKEEQVKRDKHEQKNHCVLSNNIAHNDVVKPRSQFRQFNRSISDQKPNFGPRGSFAGKSYGKKVAEECRVVKKATNSSAINADTASHVIGNGNGDCEEKTSLSQKSNRANSGKNPNFSNRKPFYRNFNGKKGFKKFKGVKNVSNTTAEKSVDNVAVVTTEFEDQKVKKEMKIQPVVDEETRVKEGEKLVKMESNSSGMNADTANHVIGDGDCEEKSSRFQKSNRSNSGKNPNFRNRKQFRTNFNGKKRFKKFPVVKNVSNTIAAEQSMANIAVVTAEFDDQKAKKEMKIHTLVDEEARVNEGEKLGNDQTVEEKDDQVEVENQTVGEKDNQVTVKDQTVEIEQKFKEVSVSRLNGRSMAVMEGKRREYGGYHGDYHGGYRRGYGRCWVGERGKYVVVDQVSGSGRSTAEIKGWTGMHRGYSGFEKRGKNSRRVVEVTWVKKKDVC